MIKAVLDSSVWVAGSLSNRGASFELLRQGLYGHFDLVVSEQIVEEVIRALNKPYGQTKISPSELASLESVLNSRALPVSLEISVVRDSQDDIILACAIEWNADYLVSLDQDLTILGECQGIKIIRPKEFLEFLRKEGYDGNYKRR